VTKMPLFGNTFSPKKIPPRKSASLSSLHTLDRSTREVELGLEYGSPMMNIGGQSNAFDKCTDQYICSSLKNGGSVSSKEMQRLKKRNLQLEEENNLLKLKIEILFDMLSETTAESHLLEKELEEVKNHHRRKK
uniref:Chibby 1, beta catenin antagonist n=1 Tax=Myripristis murdjan TaxID=586833 RepID=A0A667XA64_9TELE